MEIKCVFAYNKSCWIRDQVIPENIELKFILEYPVNVTNLEINSVSFFNCVLTKVPQGLTKAFPNLNTLDINSSNLKNINKNDMAEYKNLTQFNCTGNKIEFLPGDLFEEFEKLEHIVFDEVNLRFIEPNILDGLENLNHVSIGESGILEIWYDENDEENSDPKSIEEIKIMLFEKYAKKYSKKAELFGDLKACLEDESTKDFKISIEDREFNVHKFLLIARSPTLADILKNNPEIEDLNMLDIPVDIFEDILKFLYTDEFPKRNDINYLQLFAASGKLKIENLHDFAAYKVYNLIDQGNAIEVFKLSSKYEHDRLKKKSFNEIKKMFPKYHFKDNWASNYDFVMKVIAQFKENDEKVLKLEQEFNIFSE